MGREHAWGADTPANEPRWIVYQVSFKQPCAENNPGAGPLVAEGRKAPESRTPEPFKIGQAVRRERSTDLLPGLYRRCGKGKAPENVAGAFQGCSILRWSKYTVSRSRGASELESPTTRLLFC